MPTRRQQPNSGTTETSSKFRVKLALPTGRDKATFVRLREDSSAWLERWEPLLPGGRSPICDEAFDRLMATADTDTSRRMLIRLAAPIEDWKAGQIIGQVSINNIARGPFQSCTMGYWLAEPFAGRGLMSEALAQAVSLALGTGKGGMSLHRVEANIMPRNKPSLSLVKRLGFRFEGLAQRYLCIAGVWEDHERWSLTVEEWPGTEAALKAARTARSHLRG